MKSKMKSHLWLMILAGLLLPIALSAQHQNGGMFGNSSFESSEGLLGRRGTSQGSLSGQTFGNGNANGGLNGQTFGAGSSAGNLFGQTFGSGTTIGNLFGQTFGVGTIYGETNGNLSGQTFGSGNASGGITGQTFGAPLGSGMMVMLAAVACYSAFKTKKKHNQNRKDKQL